MAKARKRAGKRATAAGRNKPRARKSGAPKAAGTASRKPKSAKSKVAEATTRKQETSPGSEAASLRQQLKAARLQQDAIAEILQVISNSPGELGPVFRMVLENATRLCDAKFGTVHRFDGKAFYFAADVGAPQALAEYMRRPGPVQSPKGGMLDRIKTTRQMQHTPDYAADRVPGLGAKLGGARSTLGVPILRDDVLVGALVIYRQEVRPFSDREIDLVRSFAAQAAIAIENARLFNEVRKRTNDLTEALQQQTATAEVLQTISRSSFDVDAILRMLVKTAARLCNAGPAQIFRRDGDVYRYAASQILEPAYREHEQHIEIRPGRGTLVGRVALEKRPVQILDAWDDPEYEEKDAARIGNVRSMLAVPLLRDGESIGAFAMARDYVEPFTESQVKLVSTFADQAVIAIENARLFNETQEALERQTATSDILKVIASSPDNVQPVFEAIASSARRLIGGFSTAVHLVVDDMVHLVAFTPTNPEADAILVAAHPRHRSEVGAVALVENGEIAQIADSETADAHTRQLGRARGWRGLTLTPLMNHGNFIGFIASTRRETGVLGNHHVELLRTFADQAVIAIENARLFNETREALERQTATSDILATINGSGGFLAPVFECILEKAHQLCGAPCGSLQLYQDGRVQPVAIRGMTPAFSEFLQAGYPITEGVRAGLFADHPVQRVDMVETLREQPDEPSLRAAVELGGIRTMASVPLLKDGVAFGRIIAARQEVRPFDDKQLATLQGFAAQAVIAIENARLLNELRARTDDLGESLQQQTATADVLKVISRSAFDLDSVMNTLAHSAGELCKAKISALYLREGDVLIARGVAEADAAQAEFLRRTPLEANSSTYLGRTLLAGAVRNIANVSNETEIGLLKKFSEVLDFKSILFVPLMREGRGVGVFALARKRTGLFSQREVDLVQTFADQAVIAIENARLFEEVQAKTRDLTESLQQQTAVGEVLGTISRSTFELQPVLDTLVKAAAHLCDAEMAFIMRREGEIYRAGASVGFSDEYAKFLKAHPITPDRGTITGRAVLDRRTVQIVDVASDPEYTLSESTTLAGQRTALGVPLLRENEPIGVIVIARRRVQEFTARQIELVSTFADQAVIAIENVRLFNETQEALERQTATADILKVIASSPSDVQPVFEAIATRANSLVGGFSATVFRFIDGMAHLMAFTPTTPEADEVLKSTFPSPLDNFVPFQMARDGEVAQVPDTEALTGEILDIARARGFRSMLFAPLTNKGASIGFIAVTRVQPGAFSDHHVQLLRTFADQAVIAIENVRLFDEVQARTRELSKSLDDLRAAQDRLVQTEKLASLGQLTAGIAHEIKNPLNFVNNFSALSAELTDELKNLLNPVVFDEATRAEVEELTGLLKDNLGKVVQHGKRADSIVKNMLLHSREGSGERRPSDINALVEESLNLAYHGARAEKSGFNITLKRDLDPAAGTIELYPQEITRVLLNLISNGFYAASKRNETGENGFEPTLSAATKDLGKSVEIRIRDNGTGIPAEVREKMFNPFFTTKPAGEGTGLGLSMSYDIVVKQHGGSIDVETRPGAFTEFIITLPRELAARRNPGGAN
ncbi:GAF domain-containing protein [Bradyrhizobium sp.]|uniref:GAF domain-containing protein n=1 Tax=Bradyrhizobium sp. TaxID=376 RepID=UPI002D2DD99B|nr:GAF domain-containing protein [Bradyrhizobium sp.]HZR73876.1 GAF domain-containing protein [Bradyrhizobium sp.]